MKSINTAIFILLATFLTFAKQSLLPSGYHYPKESDYIGDWKDFRKKIPVPFHLQADFNSDGLKDDVWILIRNDGKGCALFVFLNQRNGPPQIIRLVERDALPQRFGIVLAPRGRYETACGKGYFECAPGEREWLQVNKPAICFFVYESAESIFYWKPKMKSFQEARLSD
jgi:hypothetical protein